MDSRDSSVLLALQDIRLIANEPPYLSLLLFTRLRNLQIDMGTVRLPESLTWKILTDLSLRGAIDIDKLVSGDCAQQRCLPSDRDRLALHRAHYSGQ
ncbi:hypothetical protein BJX96DRAFT_158459 [Aspergillus floccosus]